MSAWTKEMRALWEKLALGGVTMEKRRKRNPGYRFGFTRWYVTLPIDNYLNGPFPSKSRAVEYAAGRMMEEDYRGGNA